MVLVISWVMCSGVHATSVCCVHVTSVGHVPVCDRACFCSTSKVVL